MQVIQAECCFLHQGAQACVVIGDQEELTPDEIVSFALEHGAKTKTGLYLVNFPQSQPGQTLMSSAQLDGIFTNA